MVLRKREKCVKIKSSFQNKKSININLGFHKLTPDVKPQNVSRHCRKPHRIELWKLLKVNYFDLENANLETLN